MPTIRERLAVEIAKLDRNPTRDSTISYYAGQGDGHGAARVTVMAIVPASADAKVFKDEVLRALKAEAEQLQREAEDAYASMEELR